MVLNRVCMVLLHSSSLFVLPPWVTLLGDSWGIGSYSGNPVVASGMGGALALLAAYKCNVAGLCCVQEGLKWHSSCSACPRCCSPGKHEVHCVGGVHGAACPRFQLNRNGYRRSWVVAALVQRYALP